MVSQMMTMNYLIVNCTDLISISHDIMAPDPASSAARHTSLWRSSSRTPSMTGACPAARACRRTATCGRAQALVQTVSRAYEELIRRGLISGEIGGGARADPSQRAGSPLLPERLGEVIDLSILGNPSASQCTRPAQAGARLARQQNCRRARHCPSGPIWCSPPPSRRGSTG